MLPTRRSSSVSSVHCSCSVPFSGVPVSKSRLDAVCLCRHSNQYPLASPATLSGRNSVGGSPMIDRHQTNYTTEGRGEQSLLSLSQTTGSRGQAGDSRKLPHKSPVQNSHFIIYLLPTFRNGPCVRKLEPYHQTNNIQQKKYK